MTARRLPETALERTLRLIRLPADQALRAAPEGRVRTAVGQALDRADAAVREAAGRALGDERLRDEAQRLRSAVAERERARVDDDYADPGARTRHDPQPPDAAIAAAVATERAIEAAERAAERRQSAGEADELKAAVERARDPRG